MKKVLIFSFIILGFGINKTHAYDFSAVAPSGQTLYYKIIDANSHTVSVTYPNLNWQGFTKPTGSLIIPSNVAYSGINYSVISIGESSFRDCSGITSVTLPTSIDSIIQYAFWGCSSITNVTIPLNVIFLDRWAFAFCQSLSTIYYNAANCISGINSNVAENRPFYGCDSITAINIGSNVQSIPEYLFYSTGITTLTIPENVTSIAATSFWGCSSLTIVNYNAINCSLSYNNYISSHSRPFVGCNNISTINIGNSVTTIPNNMFEQTGITTITIPSNVTQIGDDAFKECTSLQSLYFNATNCQTASGAYWGCTSLSSVTMSSNVHRIPDHMFSGTLQISGISINIPNSVSYIGNSAFYGCSGITGTLVIPTGVTYIGRYAFYGCSGITGTITIPSGITKIRPSTFYNCTGLTGVVIPSNVRIIDTTSFSGCSSLTSVTIGANVDSLRWGAFTGCSSLTTINYQTNGVVEQQTISSNALTQFNIGSNVQRIPNNLIYNCPNLTSLTLPNSLTYIGQLNFMSCGLSGNLVLPASITEIGVGAFSYCTGLDSIKIDATTPPVVQPLYGSTYIFSNCWNKPLCVPCECISAYQSAAGWNNFTNITCINNSYTVSLSVNNNVMGSVSGGGTYTQGATATISATANSGYHFDHWSDGNTQNPRTITVTSNISLTAYFLQDEVQTYTVTLNTNNASMGSVSGGGTYNAGTTITITATANNGYYFEYWSDGNTQNPRSITVNSNITLTAYFAQNTPTYTITVISNNTTMGTVTGGGTYEQGARVQISAIPNNGYHFDHWSDGNTQNPRTITVNSNISLTAYFAQNTQYYTVTLSSNDYSMGTVTGGGQYEQGSTAICVAIPYNGYHFVRWSDNNTQNPRNITVNSNITLTAFFAANAGIDDIDDAGIIVYVKDYKIHIDEAFGEKISIYTIDGRTIASLPRATEHVAIPVTTIGVYIVKIGNHPARKVVVIK